MTIVSLTRGKGSSSDFGVISTRLGKKDSYSIALGNIVTRPKCPRVIFP